jgi:AbiEi antitoxin C-terminal domain
MLCIAQHTTVWWTMNSQLDKHDMFISALVGQLSQEPSTSLNPHCLSERALYKLFNELFAQGHRPQPSMKRTKAWLEEIGLLTPIVIDEYPDGSKPKTRFYRLAVSRKVQVQPSPLELLQAYDAAGVICYFTAVAFHSLSTQPPAHHHVAIPTEPRSKIAPSPPRKKGATPSAPKKADPLGTWLFTCKGLRYYQTSRETRLVPGIQTRYTSPTSLIRITTLEQTLLDTLHRPLSCGGPAVVMEAWEQGLSRLNEGKLEHNLRQMDHLPIAQRLGYILANFDYKPGPALASTLDAYLARLDPDDPSACQQLFPGVKYTHLRHPWLVYGPA